MSTKKQAYYFSHDANAHRHPNLQALRMVHGEKGYGWFWILIEMMRERANYSLSISGTYDMGVLAKEMNCEKAEATKFIDDCINEFRLFESDGESIWNNSLLQRMTLMEEIRMKKRAGAKKRWEIHQPESQRDANAVDMHSITKGYPMQLKEMKGNERKENQKIKDTKEPNKYKAKDDADVETSDDKLTQDSDFEVEQMQLLDPRELPSDVLDIFDDYTLTIQKRDKLMAEHKMDISTFQRVIEQMCINKPSESVICDDYVSSFFSKWVETADNTREIYEGEVF